MIRMFLFVLAATVIMSGCSTPLQLNNHYVSNNAANAAPARQVEFVPVSMFNSRPDAISQDLEKVPEPQQAKIIPPKIELPTRLQVKYAALLDVLPSMLSNIKLLETIDSWYGTRYRYGGTTRRGIDCSAFVREIYRSAFDIELPRTAREQYQRVSHVSFTDLKEGDLLFFNTTGGISHVGMYLRNNKFVHASSGRGVIVSDLYDFYYISRFRGAGRIAKKAEGDDYMTLN